MEFVFAASLTADGFWIVTKMPIPEPAAILSSDPFAMGFAIGRRMSMMIVQEITPVNFGNVSLATKSFPSSRVSFTF